jgi:hypothetical protein
MRYKEPKEREIPAVKTQIKLLLFSTICVLLLLGCLHLWTKGIPTRAVAAVIYVLLCISIVLHIISVFRDGFVAMGRQVVRDDHSIWRFLSAMVVVLLIAIFAIIVMYN